MPFVALNELPRLELFPGIRSALVAGERVMLSALEMEDGGVVPEHSHPHEQAGLVLEGKLRLRIGDEERELEPGDAFLIPPHVVHSGVVTDGPARVLDIFSPVRDDYVNRYNSFTGTGGDTRWHDRRRKPAAAKVSGRRLPPAAAKVNGRPRRRVAVRGRAAECRTP